MTSVQADERRPAIPRSNALWGVGDQAVSMASNFLLTVIVARVSSPRDFGLFTLTMAGFILVLGVARAVVSEIVIIRHAVLDIDEQQVAYRQALGATAAIAVPLAVIFLAAEAAIFGSLGSVTVIIFVALAPLLLQDAARFLLITVGQARLAFYNDMAWLVLELVGFAAVLELAGHGRQTELVVAAWAVAGAACALIALRQLRSFPHLAGGAHWLRRNADLSWPAVVEFLSGQGAAQLVLFIVSAGVGVEAAGGWRGAFVLFGPLGVLTTGLGMAIVPALARQFHDGDRSSALRTCLVAAAVVAGASALLGLVLTFNLFSIGSELLGKTWPLAAAVMAPVAVQKTLEAFSLGAVVGLRGASLVSRSMRVRLVLAALSIAVASFSFATTSLRPVAWGQAAVMSIGLVLFWLQLVRHVRNTPAKHRVAGRT